MSCLLDCVAACLLKMSQEEVTEMYCGKSCSTVICIYSIVVGLKLTGPPAQVLRLSKEYKIFGVPFSSFHTDEVFNNFKQIPLELLKLKPPAGKQSLSLSMLSNPDSRVQRSRVEVL